MSGTTNLKKLRLKIDLPDSVHEFVLSAVEQVNNGNPALFETVGLKVNSLMFGIKCNPFKSAGEQFCTGLKRVPSNPSEPAYETKPAKTPKAVLRILKEI